MNIFSVEQENETRNNSKKNQNGMIEYQEHPPPLQRSDLSTNKLINVGSSSSTISTLTTITAQQQNDLDKIDIIDSNTNKLTDEERKRRHYLECATQRMGILNSKFSTKCLIMFGILSISIVIICCILMGVFTTSYILKSNKLTSYLNQLENNKLNNNNNPYADDLYNSNNNSELFLSDKSNKFERNAFNWIKDTIRKTFFGLKDEDISNNVNNLNLHAKSNNDLFKLPPMGYFNDYQFSECGRAAITPSLINTRIMHGKEALKNSWPWAVSIGLDGPRDYVPHACGGTLLNKRYVITAAHCVTKSSVFNLVGYPIQNIEKYKSLEKMIKIYVGVHDRLSDIKPYKMYNVESITIHDDFDSYTFKNDLALIRLDRDVEPSQQVGFACLSKATQVVPGDTIYAVGWGFTEDSRNQASRYLMQVDLTVQRKDTCLIQYIDQDQFCAGNIYKKKDTCNGDSGGPLLKLFDNRWTLMGVVSNGDASCSGTGIYTNIPFFYDWINSNIHLQKEY